MKISPRLCFDLFAELARRAAAIDAKAQLVAVSAVVFVATGLGPKVFESAVSWAGESGPAFSTPPFRAV